MPQPYYFVCDEALESMEYIRTPYSGRGIGIWKDSFNFHLASMRQTIERAFGILTRRWGILWRPLSCALDRWSLVITVCTKLHNLCIDANIPFDTGVYEDYAENDLPSTVHLNLYNSENEGHRSRNSHESSMKRTVITNFLQANGMTRPTRAFRNSRA